MPNLYRILQRKAILDPPLRLLGELHAAATADRRRCDHLRRGPLPRTVGHRRLRGAAPGRWLWPLRMVHLPHVRADVLPAVRVRLAAQALLPLAITYSGTMITRSNACKNLGNVGNFGLAPVCSARQREGISKGFEGTCSRCYGGD